jgi:hypothetical protein
MQVEPLAPRFRMQPGPDGLSAVIPARRNWFVLFFLVAWLCGWVFGAMSVTGELFRPSERTPVAFLAFWLTGWTIGGVFVVTAVLWQLAGREIITINSLSLSYRLEAFGIGHSRSFHASEVRHLRATEYQANAFTNQRSWFPQFFGSGVGPVAFDYGARTIRMAPSLEEAEAKMLVGELRPRLPRTLSGT